jgi:hypothetical protein
MGVGISYLDEMLLATWLGNRRVVELSDNLLTDVSALETPESACKLIDAMVLATHSSHLDLGVFLGGKYHGVVSISTRSKTEKQHAEEKQKNKNKKNKTRKTKTENKTREKQDARKTRRRKQEQKTRRRKQDAENNTIEIQKRKVNPDK